MLRGTTGTSGYSRVVLRVLRRTNLSCLSAAGSLSDVSKGYASIESDPPKAEYLKPIAHRPIDYRTCTLRCTHPPHLHARTHARIRIHAFSHPRTHALARRTSQPVPRRCRCDRRRRGSRPRSWLAAWTGCRTHSAHHIHVRRSDAEPPPHKAPVPVHEPFECSPVPSPPPYVPRAQPLRSGSTASSGGGAAWSSRVVGGDVAFLDDES